jgi:hypothetical protein
MRKIGYTTLITVAIAVGGASVATASPVVTPVGPGLIYIEVPYGETWNCSLGSTGPTPYSGVRPTTLVGGAQIWTVWVPGQYVHAACTSSTFPFLVYYGIQA